MGTVTITSAGFAVLPASAPTHWPPNLVWPAAGSVNASKAFTISDADVQQMLSWIAETYNATLVGNNPPPVTQPATAYFLAWLTGFMKASTDSVQRQQTLPQTVPPPIVIQ